MRTDYCPRIIAHRGNSLQFPENTIESFQSALEIGCDALETDVWLTRDSKLLVWHDETVDRTTECTGPVSSFTLKELQRMDAAYRFKPDEGFPLRASGIHPVSLEDLLCTFPNALFNIDLKSKDERIIDVYYDILASSNALDRVCTASFHQSIHDAMAERHPELLMSLGPRQVWRHAPAIYLEGRLHSPRAQESGSPVLH